MTLGDKINAINDVINEFIWGVPMIILLMGTGLYFTIRLGAPQFTKIRYIFKNTISKLFKKSKGDGSISSGEAALVTLGAIVGSGNIAGVATAIASGGPGAIFWMWIAAILGMATKYIEIGLGILYRKVNHKTGEVKAGPMYYLRDGLKSKFLGGFYALMAVIETLVIVGMVDSNTIVCAVQEKVNADPKIIAVILMVFVGAIIFGGIKRLGKFSKWFVPFMGCLYVLCGIIILSANYSAILPAFGTIFSSAFTPKAAVGGFAGATIAQVIRYGLARGAYSNEAGFGSAAITHGPASVDNPITQSLWGPTEVFIDTIIVNTITGLIVIIAGLWTTGETGAALVMQSFDTSLPGGVGSIIIMIASILFSLTCLTSSSYVCEECAEFLFGTKSKIFVRVFWLAFIFIGCTCELELVWNLADTVNGIMAIPNLIGVLFLGGTIVKMSKEYFAKVKTN